MYKYRKRTPAGRLDPNLFACLEECDRLSMQCIAHIQQVRVDSDDRRCRRKIDFDDYSAAKESRQRAESLPDGPERDAAVRGYVLLRCCDISHHRDKLRMDDTGCLEELIKSYSAKMAKIEVASIVQGQVDELVFDEFPRVITQTESQEVPNDEGMPNAEVNDGMILRSGVTLGGLTNHTVNEQYFVPYKSQPQDCISKVIHQSIPYNYTRSGEIYSYTCPEYAGFVKIGFGRTALERMEAWQLCEAGASLSKSIAVTWPKRIERLIHLQLKQHRFKISRCRAPDCRRTHVEWFKLSADEVNQVMDDWSELIAREPLYGADGRLTEGWTRRISRFNGEITAKALLDVLDIELVQELQQACLLQWDSVQGSETLVDNRPEDDGIEPRASSDEDTFVENFQDGKTSSEVTDKEERSEPVVSEQIVPSARVAESNLTAVVEVVPEAATTAIQIMDQQDRILAFFNDFMSCMRQYETTDIASLNLPSSDASSVMQTMSHPAQVPVCTA